MVEMCVTWAETGARLAGESDCPTLPCVCWWYASRAMKPNHGHLPYSLAIACSSTLLFLVQPIIAKAILPRFGGSAGVWVACMLFFQVVLLVGYLYSFCLTRYLSAKAQA